MIYRINKTDLPLRLAAHRELTGALPALAKFRARAQAV
jgi:hypothetical protein